jgi:hypothetical protein
MMDVYSPDELRAKIASHEYGAELCLQHAMANIESMEAQIAALRKDAERYRYLRNRNPADVLQTSGDAAGCWIDCEAGDVLTLLTGEDADAAIDAAMAKP